MVFEGVWADAIESTREISCVGRVLCSHACCRVPPAKGSLHPFEVGTKIIIDVSI